MSRQNLIFQRSILEARAADSEAYRQAVEVALDFYYGLAAQRKYFDFYGKITPETWARIEPLLTHTNITALIANKLGGGLYEEQPTRHISRNDKPLTDDVTVRLSEAWEYDDTYIDMGEICALSCLLGNILLVPTFDSDDEETRVMIYTPDQFRVIQDEYFPQKANAYLMTWTQAETFGSGQARIYTKIIDRQGWRVVDGDMNKKDILLQRAIKLADGKLWEGENPVPGLMPLVHMRYKQPIGSGMCMGQGLMNELIPANLALNILVTSMQVLAKDKGMTTLVAKNIAKDDLQNLRLGSINTVMHFQNSLQDVEGMKYLEASLQYISPDSSLSELQTAIQNIAGMVFSRFGLRNQNPLAVEINQIESGIAKWMADAELRGAYKKQVPRQTRVEKELAHHWMIADLTGRGKALPDWLRSWDYDYDVRFNIGSPAYNLTEQILLDEHLRTLGIRNAIDACLEYEPDIKSREEAINKIVAISAENYELKQRLDEIRPKPPGVTPGRFDKLGLE